MNIPQARREDIDWLRIIAVLLLFPFHSGMIFFSKEDFYFKISYTNQLLDYLILFLSPWHMPLLFFLAGASSYYSLKYRTSKDYIIERTSRLLIPLIFGILVIVPPQSYIAYISKNKNSSLTIFLSFYFRNFLSDLTGYEGTFTPAHLWFILYLYLYSLLSVKFLSYLVKNEKKIQTFLKLPFAYGILLAYPILIGILDQLPTISTKNPFYYYAYFIIGFITPLSNTTEFAIFKIRRILISIGIITMFIYLYLASCAFEKYSIGDILYYVLRRYNAWIWVLIVFSAGIHFKNFTPKIFIYLSEASYPVYICHQTIIIFIAFLLSKIIPTYPLLFFTTCLILSIILTFLIYHTLIRKIKTFRILFGMKAKNLAFGEAT